MKRPDSPNGRGPQILRTLIEQGPLSSWGLRQILKPTPKVRKLLEALQRLCERRLITRYLEARFRGAGTYYSVTRDESYWNTIVDMIGCKPSEILLSQCHHTQLLHSEECALWAERFRAAFPGAIVLREYNIRSSPLAMAKLLARGSTTDELPDIFIILPSAAPDRIVTVAIEIERFTKSQRRLVQKLRSYCNETHIDGLIYICEDVYVAKRVRSIYQSIVAKDALAIAKYADNFLLLRESLKLNSPAHQFHNSRLETLKLMQWFQYLQDVPKSSRHNDSFIVRHSDAGAPISEGK